MARSVLSRRIRKSTIVRRETASVNAPIRAFEPACRHRLCPEGPQELFIGDVAIGAGAILRSMR